MCLNEAVVPSCIMTQIKFYNCRMKRSENLIGTANSRAAEVNSLNLSKLPGVSFFIMNDLGTRLGYRRTDFNCDGLIVNSLVRKNWSANINLRNW